MLFTPVGVALALRSLPFRKAILFGTLFSGTVEVAQLAMVSRDASIGDVLMNGLGTGVGWQLVALAPLWLSPQETVKARLSLAWTVVLFSVFGITAYLFAPSFPRSPYFGQWTPNLAGLEWYRGRVLEARIETVPLPSQLLANSDTVRHLLLRGSRLDVSALGGPAVPALSSLFSIVDHQNRQILLLGPDGDDLVFRFRTRAAAVRLDQPQFRLSGAIENVRPGDPLAVSVWKTQKAYCVEINSTSNCHLAFDLGLGWALLSFPRRIGPWFTWLAQASWIAVLLVPSGFWLGKHTASLAGVALIGLALLLIPWVTGLAPTPWHEWAAALFGAGIGIALRQRVNASRRC